MSKYNTNKKYFESILKNFKTYNLEITLNIKNTEIINCFENKKYIGLELNSTTTCGYCSNCYKMIKRKKGKSTIVMNFGVYNTKKILVKLHQYL